MHRLRKHNGNGVAELLRSPAGGWAEPYREPVTLTELTNAVSMTLNLISEIDSF